jgi:FKBP-type peptidyl-prolyl cis-trans isomerase 2
MVDRRILVLAAAAILVLAACSGDGGAATTVTTGPGGAAVEQGMTARDGDIVEVHYVGTLDDGTQFDSSRDRGSTFTFTVGAGEVIPGFDEAVRGARVGDVRTVRMEAADAYGEWTEDNVIEVPFNPEQGDVAVGDDVYLTNGQPAVVLEVNAETVTLDANHPLAGEALTFEIEVISITRE